MPLEVELAYFNAEKAVLLKHHEGKFVLVVGREVLGVFDTHDEAYKAGVTLKGNVPMLIKQVVKDEPTESIPAMVFGLIGPRL